jgi:putative endonuclease
VFGCRFFITLAFMVLFVYILECADGSFYTGVTNNLDRRIAEHQEGDDPKAYTFSRRPVKLVYFEDHSDPHYAIDREKQIKGWSRKKKIAMIKGEWDKLPELSKSKSNSSNAIARTSTGSV